MACIRCKWRGFIEVTVLRDPGAQLGAPRSALAQCWHCKDVRRYADAVVRMLGMPPILRGPAQVIPFRRKGETSAGIPATA